MKRLHAFISGKVQGVFFRDNTRDVARGLQVTGWVRNLEDGRVEVVAEGDKEKLEQLVAYLHKGPSSARVIAVEVKWENYSGKFNSFEIRY